MVTAAERKNHLADLDTPCLVIDMAAVGRNLTRMAAIASNAGVRLRPHVKTHKIVRLARTQVELGAVGVTCAKISEAEVMADGGIDDIFIAHQVVGRAKVARLVALADRAAIRVGVDSLEVAQPIADHASRAGVTIGVLIEVDVGLGRAGVATDEVPSLAHSIRAMPGLRFDGLFGYGGYAGGSSPEDRQKAADRESDIMNTVIRRLRGAGVACREISLGGTPLAADQARLPDITEIRPGTYVFGDAACVERGVHREDDIAATVLARVVSRPAPGRAVLDAGSKALEQQRWAGAPDDAGWARVRGHPEARVTGMWEEHSVLALNPALISLQVGEVVELLPNHVCPVINLYDRAIAINDHGELEELPIDARGCSQ